MEASTVRQHCHCKSQRLNVLTVAFTINLLLISVLIFIQLYHRADVLQVIKEYQKDVEDLRQQVKRLKLTSRPAPHEGKPIDESMKQTKEGSNSSPLGKMKQVSSQNTSKRSLKKMVSKDCPFRKRPRICSYVIHQVLKQANKTKKLLRSEIYILRKKLEMKNAFEVSKQRNQTETLLRNEIDILRKELKEYKKSQDVHANIALKARSRLRNFKDSRYYLRGWRNPFTTDCKESTENLQYCRRYFESQNRQEYWKIDYEASEITIKTFGYFWFSLQITMERKPIKQNYTDPNLIAKVSIVMKTKEGKYFELFSQVPQTFQFTDGDIKTDLTTVSMSGPAYLRRDCTIKVIVTLKSNGIQQGEKKFALYDEGEMSSLGVTLMTKKDDDGQDPDN